MSIKLIVGLGNPGSKYEPTRHNAGFWFVERVAQRFSAPLGEEKKFSGATGTAYIDGSKVRLLKPLTYMNKSGDAVYRFTDYYDIAAEEVLVVHDELDLEPGTIRLKKGGGHGGHNGLRDIAAKFGKDFYRLRTGIGHPGHRDDVVNFVLHAPSAAERELIDNALDNALAHLSLIVAGDFARAMNSLHSTG